MNYKNAFKCKKCPCRNDEEGCPVWWEYMQTNHQTGEERLIKQCGFQGIPLFLIEVIKASNRPAAEMSALRNDAVKAISKLAALGVQKQVEAQE